MPRRRSVRTLEEEEEFQQRRREIRNENQRRRRQMIKEINIVRNNKCRETVTDVIGTLNNDCIIELNDVAEDISICQQIICVSNTSNNEIEEHPSNSRSTIQQNIEYQTYYRSQRRHIPVCFNNTTILSDIEEYYIGSMDVSCTHCNAKHFAAEKISNKGNSFHDCCNHGAVYLEPLPQLPQFLHCLFVGSHRKSNDFFKHIRSYNSSYSFASFNANLINFRGRRSGPYCFKIQGQIYYQINTALHATQNESPTYGQLFIVDSNEAIDHRLNLHSDLDFEIVQNLEHIMRECNIFAQSYQMMGEELNNQQQLAIGSGETLPELRLAFMLKPGMDRRRYNIQRTNEVAAVFKTTSDGEIPDAYVTVRNKNTKILQQVSTMDPNVEPWIYPLFYPYGTRGLHRNLTKLNSNRRITRAQYIRYRKVKVPITRHFSR